MIQNITQRFEERAKEATRIATRIANEMTELTIITTVTDIIPNHMELVLMDRTDIMGDHQDEKKVVLHQLDLSRCMFEILMETLFRCDRANQKPDGISGKPLQV